MRAVRATHCSFNPCFDGSVARGQMNLGETQADEAVSILVLMEV